ncbi:MAG: M3 family metallopeptidase [Microthrixaceae bacterium]
MARRFFDENWIDAPAGDGKRPGAFCAYTVPSHHPYVLLNWTSRNRDVLTLAHELGHGLRLPRGVTRECSTRAPRSPWPRPPRCSARQ